jgi:hypothetical protein
MGLAQNILKQNKEEKVRQRTMRVAKQQTNAVYGGGATSFISPSVLSGTAR